MTTAELNYIAERLGSEATTEDAAMVAELAKKLAAEQGDTESDLLDWLDNRTYDWSLLREAANGDVAALVQVRTEAYLPIFS